MATNGHIQAEEFLKSLQLLSHLTQHNVEGKMVDKVADGAVSFVQVNLMRVIGLHPGRTVGDVAKYMRVSYPAATKTVDKLVRLNFLKRKEDTNDRRIAHLYLTASGQKLVDRYHQHAVDEIQRALNRMTNDELVDLNAKLLGFSRILCDEIHTGDGCVRCGAFDPAVCKGAAAVDCGYLVLVGMPKSVKE